MKILLVGSGAREHALAWSFARSPLCEKLYCAPGNAGIAEIAECVTIRAEDVQDLVGFAQERKIDFVMIGPEAPLVAGLVDRLREKRILCLGPNAAAAQLEGSKHFTKALCDRHGIPTAPYQVFRDADAAKAYIRSQGTPIVIKADGLAAGKGVTVADSLEAAEQAVDAVLVDRAFGEAGTELLVENCLTGEEVSFFALVDGHTALPLGSAQDHKRVGEGDTGPNTGGMGAYSPAPMVDAALEARIMEEIILPTVRGMRADGVPFRGILFAGLMIDPAGAPKLLEYNVRFGDPECQVLLSRLDCDLLDLLLAAAQGALPGKQVRWRDEAALAVVMAAKGYPGAYQKGTMIRNLNQASAEPGVLIFQASTSNSDNQLIALGGRVLSITARAPTLQDAQAKAYRAVERIDWPDGFYRRDIGWRALAK
jgi:phosphoribosylamine--glycine ligase